MFHALAGFFSLLLNFQSFYYSRLPDVPFVCLTLPVCSLLLLLSYYLALLSVSPIILVLFLSISLPQDVPFFLYLALLPSSSDIFHFLSFGSSSSTTTLFFPLFFYLPEVVLIFFLLPPCVLLLKIIIH